MSIETDLVLDVARGILADWMDGTYFTPPTHDEYDWHLKLTDEPGPGLVFRERETGKKFRIEMRVTRVRDE